MAAPTATLPPSSAPAELLPSTTPAPVWYRPGVADVVFLLVAVVVLRGARHTMLDDPGLGWHLRNIDAMLEQGWWLTEDPFTEPVDGTPRPWRTNQWLGEVPFWLGERWAGLEGIAVVNALAVAFMIRYFYRMLLRDGLPWPAAVAWTALTTLGTSCSWTARPNVFTLLFVLLTARACEQFHQGRLSRTATLWLWPLFALWANVHGGFVAGFVLLVATLLLETGQGLLALSPETRSAARGRAGHLALLGAGAFAATLLNPYGLGLYRWVFQLLGDSYFMDLHQEWKSPDFHARGAMRFELLILLFPALLAVTARRPNLVELGLAVLWLHFALGGFRYVALWVVVAAPLLARSSVAIPWLREAARRLQLSAEGDSPFATRSGPAPWLWTAAFALALLGWARVAQGQFARHKPEIIAAPALDRFLEIHAEWRKAHGRRPVIFHSYDWGGYLTWHGWPDVRNWIDDRNEVQGKERVEEYFAILRAEPDWERKLDAAGVELICVESQAPLNHRLTQSPRWDQVAGSAAGALAPPVGQPWGTLLAVASAQTGGKVPRWRERYRDDYAVIFERVEAGGR